MSAGISSMVTSLMGFWRDREPREQWALGLGTAALVVMLFYQLVWTPIDHWAAEQQHRLVGNQALAGYVAQAKAFLTRPKAVTSASHSLAPAVDQSAMQLAYNSAKNLRIDGRIDRREPAGDNGVRLQFSAVDFSALGRWIATMNQAGFTLAEAEITPASGGKAGPGQVDAKLKLEGKKS